MATTLTFETMTVEQKIQAMESLWDSLCAKADSIPTPAWHGEVLAQREQSLQSGEDRFEEWSRLIKRSKNRSRENRDTRVGAPGLVGWVSLL